MKKLLLLLLFIPLVSFGQENKQIELRKNEKIIMSEKWSLFKPVKGKGKLYLQPGNIYLTNERFYFTTIKKAMGTKHFIKSIDFEEIEKIRKATYEKQLQRAIDLARETKEIPNGVLGLVPDGDRTVAWRWMGPVYEDTAQDKVQQSIFCRNLQELGVDSIEALKYLFPSKTDDEVAGMLSGFPFRMVGQVQRAYSQFLDLINQEMRTPHPQQPDIPMAADPRLDLTPFLYRTLESLQKEVTYAGRYRNADPIGTPTISDPTANLRGSSFTNSSPGSSSGDDASVGSTSAGSSGTSTTSASPDGYNTSPIRPYTVKPPEQPIGSSSGESIQGRIQPGGRAPEFTSANPLPGSTVSSDTRVRPGELQFPTSSFIQQSGSADIAAFEREQPGILEQLFPNFAGNQRPATPRKRGKSRKS